MSRQGSVALFVTCLVDLFYPQVGVATVSLLRRHGLRVTFPEDQTCCGQPLFNSGYHREAAQAARATIRALEGAGDVIVPSGSCGAMLRKEYLHLFHDDPAMHRKAQELAGRTYELSQYLTDALKLDRVVSDFRGKVTYHPSCHLLRGLGVAEGPIRLLKGVRGVEYLELPASDQCCGFGGSFAVKLADVSNAIMQEKLRNIRATGAEVLVASDCGCLMHMGGGLARQGVGVGTLHLAQVLAGAGHVG